jgi:hypothetical protein
VDAVSAVNLVARVDYPVRAASAAAPAAPAGLPITAGTRPAVSISAARTDVRNTDQGAPGTSRTIFDPQTNAVVFQFINASTGGVVEQLPSQTLLRQRAYLELALINGKDFDAAVRAAAQEIDTTL